MGEGLEGFLMMSSRLVEIPVSVTPTDASPSLTNLGTALELPERTKF